MENVYIFDAKFLNNKTIELLEEYPVSEKEIQLIILPKNKIKPKRKAGLLKGKIKIPESFQDSLEDMKEYMG